MVRGYKKSERRAEAELEGAADSQVDVGASRRIGRVDAPVTSLLLAVLAVVSSAVWMHMALAMTHPVYEGPDSEDNPGLWVPTAEAVPELVETIFLDGDAQPIAATANPNDGHVYVVNIGTATVAVIEGKSLLTTIDLKIVPRGATACPVPIGYGRCLNDVAINRVTNRVYVTEWYYDLAQIISGTEVVDSVYAGRGPAGVVAHCNNNSVYVLDKWTPGVTFIQGDQDLCFIPGSEPNAGVVDPRTGYVYIANSGSDSVAVLDGCTQITETAVGSFPNAITFSPSDGYVYVVNSGEIPATVSVISDTQVVLTVPVGAGHTNLGVHGFWGTELDGSTDIIAAHPDGRIYVSNWASGTVSVISDTEWLTDVVVGTNPNTLGIDPGNGYVYVANVGSDSVSVISGTEVITTVAVGDYPFHLAVNPANGYVYVANRDDRSVSILTVPRISRVWLPMVVKRYHPPALELVYVPAYGSFEDLHGRVRGVDPGDHKVAVYIYVSGWWTKPYWDAPLTAIQSDGSWSCDITTGGMDQFATQIAAFLVPNGFSPPLMAGESVLPAELFEHSVANVLVEREAPFREIEFSGRTWRVKASEGPVGPGPNYFSDREEDVWVDGDGRLHMSIVHRDGRWYCTEVISSESFGYGVYSFTLSSRVDTLDKIAVLGLFTWDDTAPEHNYREIDIEFARWGAETGNNAQYVVQPWDHPENLHRFRLDLTGDLSTHSFDWRASSVQFSSFQGHASLPAPGDELQSWLYTGPDVPPAGKENARINLWLMNGYPPSDGQRIEVIVDAFDFLPER
jgi:YVTN family beta-propeller protein